MNLKMRLKEQSKKNKVKNDTMDNMEDMDIMENTLDKNLTH